MKHWRKYMSRLAAFLALCCAALLVGCTSTPLRSLTTVTETRPPYEVWARVLQRHVDDLGRVDFAGLASDRADLDSFVNYVAQISPASHPALFPDRSEVLAYHLNAYNALAMKNVLDRGIPLTLAGLRKVGFFYFDKVRVGGQSLSLADYENKVIRPLGGARVHVALNCMAAGCPQLPRQPFLPAKLEDQLELESRIFYNDPRNVQVDDEARVLRLSEILKFFTADFLAEAPSLAAYVNRYRSNPVPQDYEVRFIKYDWTINRQPARP